MKLSLQKKGSSLAAMFAAAVIACLGLTQQGEAAVIFGTNQVLANDGSNLDNLGTLVTAVNFSSNPVRTGPFSSSNPDPAVTLNGIGFTPTPWNGSNPFFSTNASVADSNRASGVPSNEPIYGLVYDATVKTGTRELDLALIGLTVGDDYRLQMIFSSDGNRAVDVTSDGVTSALLSYGSPSGPGLVTASFTASSSTQSFVTFLGVGGAGAPQLSGFVLHNTAVAVPEPSSTALLGLGGIALMLRRRR